MNNYNRFLVPLIIGIMLLSVLLSGCTSPTTGDQTKKTITIVDDRGKSITIPYPCTKVVFLVENAMNTMYAVGGADYISGIGSIWMPQYKEMFFNAVDPDYNVTIKIGSVNNQVDLEALAKAKPDLVVLWSSDWDDKDTKAIEDTLHVPVYGVYIDSLNDLYKQHDDFAKIIGQDANGKKISDIMNATMKKVTDVTDPIPDAQRPTVYWMWGDIYGCAGLNSTANDLIYRSGGINVVSKWDNQTKNLEHPVLSMETIAALDPDVIYMWFNPSLTPNDVMTGEDFKAWRNLSAVKNGRVYELDDPFLFDFHTSRLPLTMMKVAKDINPEKFANLDLNREYDDYFVKVYGVHYPSFTKA